MANADDLSDPTGEIMCTIMVCLGQLLISGPKLCMVVFITCVANIRFQKAKNNYNYEFSSYMPMVMCLDHSVCTYY